MAIVHWNPWMGLDELRDKLDRMMVGDVPGPRRGKGGDCGYVWQPASDVYETDSGFLIQVEIPGLRKEEVIIEVKDKTLWVYGERRYEREASRTGGTGAYQVLERCYGPFARQFLLPKGVDESGISASMENGVLTLVVPRSQPEQEAKRIVIETS